MRLLFDIETDNLLPKVSKLHMISCVDIDSGKKYSFFEPSRKNMSNGISSPHYAGNIKDGLELLTHADTLLGHNIIGYDIPALHKLTGFHYDKEIIDTLVLSYMMFPEIKNMDFARAEQKQREGKEHIPIKFYGRHSLEAWGHRLGEYKGDFSDYENFTQEMVNYCEQDVNVNFEMWNRFQKTLPPMDAIKLEMDVAKICFEQEQFGVLFDKEKGQALYDKLNAMRDDIRVDLRSTFRGWKKEMKTPQYFQIDYQGQVFRESTQAGVTSTAYLSLKAQGIKATKKSLQELITAGPNKYRIVHFNPASNLHVARAFSEKYGWVPKEFNEKDGSPRINTEILKKLPFKEAKQLIEYEVLQDRCEKLNEGRKAPYLKVLDAENRIHGSLISCGTPTYRATHRNPNLSQVPAGTVPYGMEFRELFTVPKGYYMCGTDAEGLELRALAHYLYPYDNGVFAKAASEGKKEDGTDPHTVNMKAMGLDSRDLCKTVTYAVLYGAGPGKVKLEVGCTFPKAKALIDRFTARVLGYSTLLSTIENRFEENIPLISLDGRKLSIRKKFAVLNTLIQSAGAIICKRWMVFNDTSFRELGFKTTPWYVPKTEKDLIQQIIWSHDEFQYQVHECVDQVELKNILKQNMKLTEKYYKVKCPLDCGVDFGLTWASTH